MPFFVIIQPSPFLGGHGVRDVVTMVGGIHLTGIAAEVR